MKVVQEVSSRFDTKPNYLAETRKHNEAMESCRAACDKWNRTMKRKYDMKHEWDRKTRVTDVKFKVNDNQSKK